MLAALLIALLFTQDKPSIESLVRDLDADAPEVRERAQRDLFKAGPSALPALRAALAKSEGELKARIEGIILRVDRTERERVHDALERSKLLEKNNSNLNWSRDERKWSSSTDNARFSLSAARTPNGLVIRTYHETRLRRHVHGENLGSVFFDLAKVETADGRKLTLERCGQCSPGLLRAEDQAGPLKVKVAGFEVWYSPYEVTFENPLDGQTHQVGDMTVQVAWPRLEVDSRGGFLGSPQRAMRFFDFDLKPESAAQKPAQYGYGISRGCGAGPTPPGWCDCRSGPVPARGDPLQRTHRFQMMAKTENLTLDDVARIRCTIWKPVEIPLEFTVEVTPYKRD